MQRENHQEKFISLLSLRDAGQGKTRTPKKYSNVFLVSRRKTRKKK
ncbi:MAG: hypothetical protein NTZ13_01940 [Candidatus Parcubacteria bacterium]|nr:hypothetical protein [Candidatus Parcubacteria bacterium]